MTILIFLLLTPISLVQSGFTPKKYELTLTPQFFGDNEFTGNTKIHVDVTGSVKEFDLKVSKDLEVERVSFWQANSVSRGHPNALGSTAEFQKIENKIHVTLLGAITPESITELGYIEVDYKGKAGKKGANKGLFLSNAVDYETNLKNENVIRLFPILEDKAAPLTLSIITPYRAGVETTLKAGEHKEVTGKQLFSNNFNSGPDKIKISELSFKVKAPRDLVLDSN